MNILTFLKIDNIYSGLSYIEGSVSTTENAIMVDFKDQEYLNKEKFIKQNRPSIIHFYKTGQVLLKKWYNSEGFLHNENGPAFILYRRDGSIINKEYWKNGKKINKEEE